MINLLEKNILVIHPEDESTEFLSVIYKNIPNLTVVRNCNISKKRLRDYIRRNEVVIMLGHGNSHGLFSNSFGEKFSRLLINSRLVDELRKKEYLIGIWCHAKDFFKKYKLKGFVSGMFISDMNECYYYSYNVEEQVLNESNNKISQIIGDSILNSNVEETIYIYVCKRILNELSDNVISQFNLYELDEL